MTVPTRQNSSRQRPFTLSQAVRLSFGAGMALGLAVLTTLGQPASALTPASRNYYLQAVQAERRGQLDVAEQALRKAISLDPTDYLNFVKLGAVLNQEGKPNEAVSFYQQAQGLAPNDSMIAYSTAGLFEQLGQYSKAENEYVKAMRGNPGYQFALLNLARTQIQQKKYQPAITNYKNFLVNYPQHFEARRRLANLYLVTGQNQASIAEYDNLKNRFPGQFDDQVNLARALNGANEPEKALEELKIAYAREGNKADISEEMGRAHAALGQSDLAISNYRRAYRLNPEKEDLLLKMADLYRIRQKWPGAIEQYQLYLKKHPGDLGVHRQLADVYLENQQYDVALNELNDLLAKTQDPVLKYGLEKDLAYTTHMLGDLPKAIEQYETLLQDSQAATDLQLRANLALAYHKSSEYEKAAALYKELYYAQPAQLEQYKLDRTGIGSDLAAVLSTMADAAYKQGDWNAAVSQYGDATLYAAKTDYWPYLGLGNAYYSLNMPDKAYAAYGEVLNRNPNNVTARLYRTKLEMAKSSQPSTQTQNSAQDGTNGPDRPQERLQDKSMDNSLYHKPMSQGTGPQTQLAAAGSLMQPSDAQPNASVFNTSSPIAPSGMAPAPVNAENLQSPAEKQNMAAMKAPSQTMGEAEGVPAAGTTSPIMTLEALAKEDPENVEVLIALGDAYAQQNNSLAAIDVYERALTAGARSSAGTNLLTGEPLHTGTSQPNSLDATARANLLMAIGGQWQKQANFVQAKSAYERARDMDTHQPEIFYNLGIVYNELGSLDASAAAYRQALALNPNAADAKYGLAVTLDKQDKRQEALDAYKAYATMPNAQYAADAQQRIQWLNQAARAAQKPAQVKTPKAPPAHVTPVLKTPIKAKSGAKKSSLGQAPVVSANVTSQKQPVQATAANTSPAKVMMMRRIDPASQTPSPVPPTASKVGTGKIGTKPTARRINP